MLDYETFCQIRDHLVRQQLTVVQTARALALDPRTVAKWAGVEQFRPRTGVARTSKLDPFNLKTAVRVSKPRTSVVAQRFQQDPSNRGAVGVKCGRSLWHNSLHDLSLCNCGF